ncbi:unnamed protein product [Sphagnum tenellum]
MSDAENEETNAAAATTSAEADAEADAGLNAPGHTSWADEMDAASKGEEEEVDKSSNTPRSGKRTSRRARARRAEAQAREARQNEERAELERSRQAAAGAAGHEKLRKGVEEVIKAHESAPTYELGQPPARSVKSKLPAQKADKGKGGQIDSGDPYKRLHQTGPEDRAARSKAREGTSGTQAKAPSPSAKEDIIPGKDNIGKVGADVSTTDYSVSGPTQEREEKRLQHQLMFNMQRALKRINEIIVFIRNKEKEGTCIREGDLLRIKTEVEDQQAKFTDAYTQCLRTTITDRLAGIIKVWRQTMLEKADNAHRTIDQAIQEDHSDEDVGILDDDRCDDFAEEEDDDGSTEGLTCLRFIDEEEDLQAWKDQCEEDLRGNTVRLDDLEPSLLRMEKLHMQQMELACKQANLMLGQAQLADKHQQRGGSTDEASVLSHLQEIKMRNRDVSDAYKIFIMSPHSTLRRAVVEEHKTTARHALETAWYIYKAIYDRMQGIDGHGCDTSTPKPHRAPKRDLPSQAERLTTDPGNSGGLRLDSKTAEACKSILGAMNTMGDALGKSMLDLQKRMEEFEKRHSSRGYEAPQPEAGFSGTRPSATDRSTPTTRLAASAKAEALAAASGLRAEATDFKPRDLPPTTVTSTSLFPRAFKRSDSLSTVNSLRLGGRSFKDPTSYVTQGSSKKTGEIDFTSAGQAAQGFAELLKVFGRKGAGDDEVDDPEEYPPEQWYIDNLPYPWNVAPKSKKRGGDLTKIVAQAKVTPFSGSRDCYFQWRNKVLGYLHKAPGAITAKMLALTALLDIQDPVLKKMIPDETFSARSYAVLLHNLERFYGGNDRLMNYMMQQIRNFPVLQHNDSVALDEFATLVQRYVEVQAQIHEPTDGRHFFQDVYLRLPPSYHHEFGKWLAAKNVQGLLLGAPVQKPNLSLLLEWADQYLQVLRTTKEITDYTQATKVKSRVRFDDKVKNIDKTQFLRSGRTNKTTEEVGQESDSGDEAQEFDSHHYKAVAMEDDVREGDENDDDAESSGRVYFWTEQPTTPRSSRPTTGTREPFWCTSLARRSSVPYAKTRTY